MIRCINLDWLEVFVYEPISEPRDAEFFQRQGFIVHIRDYGTRIYSQMFTIEGSDGEPLLEVRREPKNPLMAINSVHLRLVNRACYLQNAAAIMSQFINRYKYTFQRISRVDICLDFERFDDNTIPRVFMQRYMRGKFAKINQSNIRAHGSDQWTGRVWNSVSWGSPSSAISTKFYNKTLELYDPKTDSYGKPYIRGAWLRAGLIDNLDRCTLHDVTQEIWRVEFSIKSPVKRWATIELDGRAGAYYSIRNTLECYEDQDRLLTIFASLCRHYFHFKRYAPDVRKDRCPDRRLFNFAGEQFLVSPERPEPTLSSRTPQPQLLRLIGLLRSYRDNCGSFDTNKAIDALLSILERIQWHQECPTLSSSDEILALQELLRRRLNGDRNATLSVCLESVRQWLHISTKAADVF